MCVSFPVKDTRAGKDGLIRQKKIIGRGLRYAAANDVSDKSLIVCHGRYRAWPGRRERGFVRQFPRCGASCGDQTQGFFPDIFTLSRQRMHFPGFSQSAL